MIRTNTVTFRSAAHRNDVHDAVQGRAQSIVANEDELRALFDVGQTLAYTDMNEPYNGALLEFPFAFEDRDTYQKAVEVLVGQTDDDLDWLGGVLDEAGIDEDFDPDSDYGRGGVREALRENF